MPAHGFHEDVSRTREIRGASNRNFGFWMTAAFTFFGLWPLRHGAPPRLPFLVAAALFLAFALVRPAALSPLNFLWTRLGLLLGRIADPIVTGLIFFLIVTPAAILLRILGKDPLARRPDPAAPSYWISRIPPGPDPATMNRQF